MSAKSLKITHIKEHIELLNISETDIRIETDKLSLTLPPNAKIIIKDRDAKNLISYEVN